MYVCACAWLKEKKLFVRHHCSHSFVFNQKNPRFEQKGIIDRDGETEKHGCFRKHVWESCIERLVVFLAAASYQLSVSNICWEWLYKRRLRSLTHGLVAAEQEVLLKWEKGRHKDKENVWLKVGS